MRTYILEKEQEKKNGFFLYIYGSTGTLSSEQDSIKYGYSDSDIHSAALQGIGNIVRHRRAKYLHISQCCRNLQSPVFHPQRYERRKQEYMRSIVFHNLCQHTK